MKGLLGAVLLVTVCVVRSQPCGECEGCVAPVGCLAGTVKDRCGCCDICAKAQYELCDHPAVQRTGLGQCGRNLECRLRNDLSGDDELEAICFCTSDGDVCGTDGVTYDNICDLKAASVRRNTEIMVATRGPCKAPPVIATPPTHTKNKTGSDVAISCEAKGFPIPIIEWTWTRVDGRTVFLPSDDIQVSVNMRGGPDKWEVTGWLQIINIKKEHEGDYTCIAQNEMGSNQATARVNVVAKGETEKKRKRQGRQNRNRNRNTADE